MLPWQWWLALGSVGNIQAWAGNELWVYRIANWRTGGVNHLTPRRSLAPCCPLMVEELKEQSVCFPDYSHPEGWSAVRTDAIQTEWFNLRGTFNQDSKFQPHLNRVLSNISVLWETCSIMPPAKIRLMWSSFFTETIAFDVHYNKNAYITLDSADVAELH